MNKDEILELVARKRKKEEREDKAFMRAQLERDVEAALANGVKIVRVSSESRNYTFEAMGKDYINKAF